MKVRELCIYVSKPLAKQQNFAIQRANRDLELEKNCSNPNLDKISLLEDVLKRDWERKTEGARIRAKMNWIEEGEKSSKYFFNLREIQC